MQFNIVLVEIRVILQLFFNITNKVNSVGDFFTQFEVIQEIIYKK